METLSTIDAHPAVKQAYDLGFEQIQMVQDLSLIHISLWALNDQLSAFQKKLNLLYLSIRTYTMTDVWNNATAGMLDRNNGEIAQIAMRRWRRAATIR